MSFYNRADKKRGNNISDMEAFFGSNNTTKRWVSTGFDKLQIEWVSWNKK